MIALKAREMGYRIVTMDATSDSPCGQVADMEVVAPLDNLEGARQLARQSDILTYEFENVSDEMLRILETESYLPQGLQLLRTTRHRIREKLALQAAGIPVAPWRPVTAYEELEGALEELGVPCVLKTATGGYDGKGQFVIRSQQDAKKAWEQLSNPFHNHPELVLEAWVPFDLEMSVIAARSPSGEVRTFPAAENIHVDNILHQSIIPARVSPAVEEQAQQLAKTIAERLNVIGLIAVEMFVVEDQIWVNELAPRPHNSGHYTMDACMTSQFEQHIRAICNLPLGDTRLHTPVVMVNILGEHVEPVLRQLGAMDGTMKLHLYGKHEAKHKRKMGHLNVLAPTVEEALQRIRELGIWNER
jgi:5-(carboxyamino)imidazole ribonucleotide synthase